MGFWEKETGFEGRLGGPRAPRPPLRGSSWGEGQGPGVPPSPATNDLRDWGWGSGGGGQGRWPLAPSPTNLLPPLPLQPGRGVLLWGEPLRRLAGGAVAWGVARGGRVLVVDAANRFDPYGLVREGRARGLAPREVLSRVQVARAFTCHQLVRLLQEELSRQLAPGSLVLILGPVNLFYDEQVPLKERRRLFKKMTEVLSAVKTRHPLLLLQPKLPRGAPNHHFGRLLAPVMDVMGVVGEIGGGPGSQLPALPSSPPKIKLKGLGEGFRGGGRGPRPLAPSPKLSQGSNHGTDGFTLQSGVGARKATLAQISPGAAQGGPGPSGSAL